MNTRPNYRLRPLRPGEYVDAEHFYVCHDHYLLIPQYWNDGKGVWECVVLEFPKSQQGEFASCNSERSHHEQGCSLYTRDGHQFAAGDASTRAEWVVLFEDEEYDPPDAVVYWHTIQPL